MPGTSIIAFPPVFPAITSQSGGQVGIRNRFLAYLNDCFTFVPSTGQRNILFSNYREGDVEYEAETEDLLHRSRQDVDVGALAEGWQAHADNACTKYGSFV